MHLKQYRQQPFSPHILQSSYSSYSLWWNPHSDTYVLLRAYLWVCDWCIPIIYRTLPKVIQLVQEIRNPSPTYPTGTKTSRTHIWYHYPFSTIALLIFIQYQTILEQSSKQSFTVENSWINHTENEYLFLLMKSGKPQKQYQNQALYRYPIWLMHTRLNRTGQSDRKGKKKNDETHYLYQLYIAQPKIYIYSKNHNQSNHQTNLPWRGSLGKRETEESPHCGVTLLIYSATLVYKITQPIYRKLKLAIFWCRILLCCCCCFLHTSTYTAWGFDSEDVEIQPAFPNYRSSQASHMCVDSAGKICDHYAILMTKEEGINSATL